MRERISSVHNGSEVIHVISSAVFSVSCVLCDLNISHISTSAQFNL